MVNDGNVDKSEKKRDVDKSEKKSEERTFESPLEKGYQNHGAWWGWLPLSEECPNKSILPADDSPGWKEGDIPQEIQEKFAASGDGDPCVQGWKLHIAVDRADIEKLFEVVSPTLRAKRIMHKFRNFDEYKGSTDDKACTIYPISPTQLDEIVPKLDNIIQRSNMSANMMRNRFVKNDETINNKYNHTIKPLSNGVEGDLALGKTGFIYCRYGAITGGIGRENKLYNPLDGGLCEDPRGKAPYPEFFKKVPDEIERHIAPTSKFGPSISDSKKERRKGMRFG